MKKLHFRKEGDTRSACEEFASPSRYVKLLSMKKFAESAVEQRCPACSAIYQRLVESLSLKPGFYWIREGETRVPAKWTGKNWWGIAMKRPYYLEEVVDPIPAIFGQ